MVPYVAWVGSPLLFDSGGIAWYARNTYDDKSTRYNVSGAAGAGSVVAIEHGLPDRERRRHEKSGGTGSHNEIQVCDNPDGPQC